MFIPKSAAKVKRVKTGFLAILYRNKEHSPVAKGKQIRTFPDHPRPYRLKCAGVPDQQGMEIFPGRQVKGAIEQNHPTHSLSLGTHQHIPVMALFPHERLAEMTACTRRYFSRRAC